MKTIGALAALLLAATTAHAAASPFYAPGFTLGGKSAAQLSADWWAWAATAPTQTHPVRDRTGQHCAVGQKSGVWFLAGGYGNARISRTCTVPAGTPLFFPMINLSHWPRSGMAEFGCEVSRARARMDEQGTSGLFVELDGKKLSSPEAYRATTLECFNAMKGKPASQGGYNAYPAASDGYWMALKPLAKGSHTLRFGGKYSSPFNPNQVFMQDIQYTLIVE